MRAVIAVVAAVVLFFGGLLVYVNVIRDSPDRLDEGDLDAALQISTPTTTGGTGSANAPEPSTSAPAAAPAGRATTVAPADPAPAGMSAWEATDASIVGYRIKEILFGVDTEAVGRTNAVTGTLTFDATTVTAVDFTVDMATVESDDSRRDRQYRDIMSVDEFPTATFTLTAPIEVGTGPVEGAAVQTTATGELTLRGVTNAVTFDVTARVENGQIGVLGSIPVVFADYGIANPSRAGITTEDNGLLEFVLVFAPSGA